MTTSAVIAQAPSSLTGKTFGCGITDGIYPFASYGYYLFMPASSGSGYQVIGIYNVADSSGTYSYSRSGAFGYATLSDAAVGTISGTFGFNIGNAGNFSLTVGPYYQTGEFIFYSNSAPSSVVGKSYLVEVSDGLYPFADTGWAVLVTDKTGNGYNIYGDGIYTADSSGTYSYSKVNTTTGKLQCNDSFFGVFTAYLASDTDASGGYAAKRADGSFQIGDYWDLNTSVAITSPTANSNYVTTLDTINLSGTSSDTAGIDQVEWENNQGGSGIASGTTSWNANGIPLSPGTNVLLVTAYDYYGISAQDSLTVIYRIPPELTGQPLSQSVVRGSNVTFNATAEGTAPLKYQWRKNAVAISGATNTTYTLVNAQTNAAANYSVVVTNIAGSTTSSNAVLTVLVPPAITANPTNRSVKLGTNTTFTVIAVGTAPLSYQWRKDSADILDATNSNFAIATVQTNDAGAYTVLVTNLAGSVLSSNATLTVNVPPSITNQPQSLAVVRGSNATFNVLATGTVPLRYQWRSNAVNIVNATNAAYTIVNVQTNHAASYSVRVTNFAGSVTSSVAMLTVLVPPGFTAQPANKTVLVGSNLTFIATGSGTSPLSYQWRKNANNLPNATNSSFNIANAQTNDAGVYSVVVTNVAGTLTSSNAALVVNAKPTILTNPVPQSAVIGSDVSFAVVAGGTSPLKYQWRKNAVTVAGATNGIYTLTNVQTNAAASYTVIVTNNFGSVTSSVASLTVTMPPPALLLSFNGTNLLFSWSTNYGGFTLQSTTNLSAWVSNPPPPVVSGSSFVVTNSITGDVRFYRLKK